MKVQLDGEWEECVFDIRKDALAALVALVEDYPAEVRRALLVCESDNSFAPDLPRDAAGPPAKYVN